MESKLMESKEGPVVFERHPRPFYPWVMWALCLILHFYNFLLRTSIYAVHPSIVAETSLMIGSVASFLDFYSIGIILFQIPVAMLIDRYGPRKISSLGLVIAGFSAILFSFAHDVYLQRIAIFFMGVGATSALVTALKIISNWFPHRFFAAMVGLNTCITLIIAGIGLPLTTYLTKLITWQQTLIDYGIIGIFYALLFFIVVRDSEPGRRFNINPVSSNIALLDVIKKVLMKKETWFIALYSAFIIAPTITYFGIWQVPFLKLAYKLSGSAAALINFVNILGFAVGAPLFGWLSTRLKSRKTLMIIGPLLSVLFFCIKVYLPFISLPVLALTSFLSTFFLAPTILAYTLIHEKNLPLVTATVIGILLVGNNIIRFFQDIFLDAMLGKAGNSLAEVALPTIQGTFLLIPISTLVGILFILLVKDSKAVQITEEN